MKHTPKPWRVEPTNSGRLIVSTGNIHNDGSSEVCEVNDKWVHKHVYEALKEIANTHLHDKTPGQLYDRFQRIAQSALEGIE
jgi:hypothetical protein